MTRKPVAPSTAKAYPPETATPSTTSARMVSPITRVLERAGFVHRTRDGRVRRCELETGSLLKASEWVERYREFWENRLDALAAYLESQETVHIGNLRHGAAVGHCMTRKLIPIVFVVVAAGLIWAVIAGLETAPAARDEATAVILRAPDGFDVDELGEIGITTAAAELAGRSGDRPGVEFTDGGDRIILLVDRSADRVVELRASRTGTIVERIWPGSIDERLAWASEHGRLDAPGLDRSTGKNLYH